MKFVSQHTPAEQQSDQPASGQQSTRAGLPTHRWHAFVNPFQLEDLLIFDEANLCRVLASEAGPMTPEHLAWSMHGAPRQLIQRVRACLSAADRSAFQREIVSPGANAELEPARHLLLDRLFWELTYWQTPELYEELTAGEHLHPGIFEQLEPWLRDKIVLDAGAGSGRSSFEAVRHGAKLVYAIEPSPGLRRILRRKVSLAPDPSALIISAGDFAHLPLRDQSVDMALSCSAFTAQPGQGGETGLTELQRVTRAGGFIVIIWPRSEDRAWLVSHGFHSVVLPCTQEMLVSFASWQSAWRCIRRFYGENAAALNYLIQANELCIPFAVLGFNTPCDYYWLKNA